MTTCIADICGGKKAIILCADKALGLGHVENTLGDKVITIQRNWRLMFAGNDAQPVFDIADRAKLHLQESSQPTALQVKDAVERAWKDELVSRTEKKLFGKRPGWTLERFFNEATKHFLEVDIKKLIDDMGREQFDLEIIVAGFDDQGEPHVFSGGGFSEGILNRAIGYTAIGNGGTNALTFLSWRETNPGTPVRGALAHVVEAKYWSELAPDVSTETDVLIMRNNVEDIRINEKDLEDVLFEKIAIANKPKNIGTRQLTLLNNLADLKGLPFVWANEDLKLEERKYDEENPPSVEPKKKRPATSETPPASGAVVIPEGTEKPRGLRKQKSGK